jgi:ribonucleoside-diphosphate reductase alpha chain
MSSKQTTSDLFTNELNTVSLQVNAKKYDCEAEKDGLRQLNIKRFYTKKGKDPLGEIEFEKRSACIAETTGEIIFELKNLEIPKNWSQLATDILASKYCRRSGVPKTGYEKSAKQIVYRISHTIREYGEKNNYFNSKEDADCFESELSFLLINQHSAFNSPVWFNVGLYHQYGIKGNGGGFYWNVEKNAIQKTEDSFSHPQGSACFINSIQDDLMSIFDLVKTEAKLFKFGSGTGTNFSTLRSKDEKLSGGGTSSGLISFLDVLDRGAAATKSGGTTRRAAKMVILNIDHPEIVDFIRWKAKEEEKAKILIKGGYPADFNGEAYRTISGQNSNNSVRVSDNFMQAVINNDKWETTYRVTGKIANTYQALDLMNEICIAAWQTADPGLQFHDTINKWHTCKNTAPINGSNPCSEYMFIDDSACNLASINLMKYLDQNGKFNVTAFRYTCRILFIAQEILVDLCSYPTERIAQNSHDFRPIGLGYANLGTLLMVKGIPYDSTEARAIAGAISAIMTGHAYRTSAELASIKGAFNGYSINRESMLNVIQLHHSKVADINHQLCPEYLIKAAKQDWDETMEMGEKYGFRNAQATVLAPTGTIGLLMDCDTTGIEPDFSIVKYKKLAGGGYFKIINQSIPLALTTLGYNNDEIIDIISYVLGHNSLNHAPHINPEALKKLNYTEREIKEAEEDIERNRILNNYTKHIHLKELRNRGLSEKQIKEAVQYINGTETVEGAPHLKKKHYPVFDTANKCGDGERFISPMGHVQMMAAVQPFLSGAISKTVNIPNESTVDDIRNIYMQSWELGLKAIALYRDGCKGSQPLNKNLLDFDEDEKEDDSKKTVEEHIIHRGEKIGLPGKRKGYTYAATIGGQKIFFRTGEYEDGKLGEIFIDMFKAGASYKSLLNCFAVAVSLGLQYGVPIEKFVEKFIFTRFEPSGFTDNPHIRNTTSVLDFVFRMLAKDYLGRTDIIQVPEIPADDTAYNVAEDMHEKNKLDKLKNKSTTNIDDFLAKMSDAPPCDVCGHITIRNGACYKCLNCGNSMGCS